MITIGICDDEKIQRRDIKEMCEKYMYDTHMDFKFVEFTSGEEVMAYKGEMIHLLLLDVELGGVDGLEVLKYVEEADWVWRVVFVTSHDEVMGRSFGIKTLDFAKKPITYKQFDKWIQVTLKENRENVVFEFSTTSGAMFKRVEDIYCLEAEGNYTYLHIRNDKCFINDKLKIWEEKMRQTPMVRVHRSYIINLAHVKTWEKNRVILENGKIICIGRQYAKKAKEEYYNYVRKHATERGKANDRSDSI